MNIWNTICPTYDRSDESSILGKIFNILFFAGLTVGTFFAFSGWIMWVLGIYLALTTLIVIFQEFID